MAIKVLADLEELAGEAARIIAAKASEASGQGRPLTIALSGGSTPKALYRLLAAPPYQEGIDWQGVHLFFGDERCVGGDNEESNFRMVKLNLLDAIEIPARNVHRMPGELPSGEGAVRYEDELRESFRGFEEEAGGCIKNALPAFDIVLLGLGSDGHTLSIFPDNDDLASLNRSGRLVVDTEGPGSTSKDVGSPDMRRITMMPSIVNNAKLVIFMVSGKAKAGAVSRVIDGEDDATLPEPPAGRIKPVSGGELLWLLDDESASLLK